MSGVPMVADVRQTYNGVALKRDQEFEASSEAEAADLVAVRMAHRVKPVAVLLNRNEYVAKVMESSTREVEAVEATPPGDAESEEHKASAVAAMEKKDGYQRRDMRAKR